MKRSTKIIIAAVVLAVILGVAAFVVIETGLIKTGDHKHGATGGTQSEETIDPSDIPDDITACKDDAQEAALKAAEELEGSWADEFKTYVGKDHSADATESDEYASLQKKLKDIVAGKYQKDDDEDEDENNSDSESTDDETSADADSSDGEDDEESDDSKDSDVIPVRVYTLIKKDSSFLMAIDSAKSPEDYGTDYGTSVPFEEAFESELISAERSAHEVSGDLIWTAYAPVFDSQGNIVAIVGADVAADKASAYPEWNRDSTEWNGLEE